MKACLIILAVCSHFICAAQYIPLGAITMWTEGYVVTTQNDTIRGQVRVGSFVNVSPAGVVVQTTDNKKIKLKGENLQLIVQQIPRFAYSTGSIPKEREIVVFERVPNPRRDGKLMLLERLTPSASAIVLYFDVSGWKKTTEYSFGDFSVSHEQDLSYIALKNNQNSFIVKRGNMAETYANLFGDCPLFVRNYPFASRRDWKLLGEMVEAYNQLCHQQK